jgi:hypothetical protein
MRIIDPNSTAQVVGPITVSMPYSTASTIAQKIGPGEFNTPTNANDIPCDVAVVVTARSLTVRLEPTSTTHFSVPGAWDGYQGEYDLGAFACSVNLQPYPWVTECVHARAISQAASLSTIALIS